MARSSLAGLAVASVVACRFNFDVRPRDGGGVDQDGSVHDVGTGDGPSLVFPVNANLRSIGTNGGILYMAGAPTLPASSAIVTLSAGASGPANVGAGDVLLIDAEVMYVQSRDSATQMTVQAPAQVTHTESSYSLRRAYTTLQAWEDARQGDLVAEDRVEVGIIYNDAAINAAASPILRIDGSITDATHFMWLTVGERQGHVGLAATGVTIDGLHQFTGIQVLDDWTRIEGIEMKGFSTDGTTSWNIRVQANDVAVDRLVIHDFKATGGTSYGVIVFSGDIGSYSVRNTFVYDGDEGIRTGDTTATGLVQGCTILGMQRRGVHASAGTLTATNVVSVSNATGDFFGLTAQKTNLSSDTTSAGAGSIAGVAAASVLTSTTAGAEDLHLLPASPASDAGMILPFCCDIDGQMRPSTGAWDIGADER